MEVALYPIDLIPKVEWREIMCTDEMLAGMENFCLIRRCDCSEDEGIDCKLVADGGSPFLSHKALSDEHIANMSMSLLGALLQKDDIRFKQKEEAKEDWNGCDVDSKRLIEGFVVEVPMPWFEVVWGAKLLHNQPVPYKKFIKGNEFDQLKADVKAIRNIILTSFKDYDTSVDPLFALTKVNHRPSNLNYWHFTLDVYPANKEGCIKEEEAKKEKSLLKKVGKQLLRFSFQRYDSLTTIPKVNDSLWLKK